MSMLDVIPMIFNTVFQCYYIMHTTYIWGAVPIDTVMFYFFLVSTVLVFIRRLVL